MYVPHYQRVRIKQDARFDLLEPHKSNRVFPEDLRALGGRAALLFRPAMLGDLDRADCLAGAVAVWSQWEGYLRQDKGSKIAEAFAARGIPLEHAHTSGHASIGDLKRMAEAIAPRMLVPIHTFEPGRFPDYFGPRVTRKEDGDWWEIAA